MIKTKVLIHYFSGTGNSAYVATLVAEEFLKAGVEPYLRSITEGILSYQSAYNLHVFVFPTYAYDLPNIMRKYLNSLPPGRGSKTMLIATHGVLGYEGKALLNASKIITGHGYQIQLTETVDCPDSFTQCMNPPSAEKQTLIYNEAIHKVSILVKSFMNGEQILRPCSPINQFWTGIVGFLFSVFGRRFLGKMYVADEACVRCGKCVQACPVGTLHLTKKPRWNYSCQACQRCINLCPQAAIQTSCFRPLILLGTFVLSYFLVNSAFKTAYLTNLSPKWIPFLFIGMYPIVELILFYLTDVVLFLLELIPGIRKLFSLSYTKSFRRYLEPHFKTMKN